MPLSFPGPVVSASVATTSGTSIDFTGIPSGVKRVTVHLNAVSTNGNAAIGWQLGPVSGVETTGYISGGVAFLTGVVGTLSAFTTLAALHAGTGGGGAVWYAKQTFELRDATNNVWTYVGQGYDTGNASLSISTGVKPLAGVLERIRLTTSNGTDAFDAGSVVVTYER